MPPAILGPLLGAVVAGVGGDIISNGQNKAAIKNQENAQAAARSQVGTDKTAALTGLNQYIGANAGPAQAGSFTPQSPFQGTNIPLAGGGPQQQGVGPAKAPIGGAASQSLSPQIVALLKQYAGTGGQPPQSTQPFNPNF